MILFKLISSLKIGFINIWEDNTLKTVFVIFLIAFILYFFSIFLGYLISMLFCHYYSKKSVLNQHCLSDKNINPTKVVVNNKPEKQNRLKFLIVHGFINGIIHYFCLKAGRIPSFALRKWLYRHVFCMSVGKNAIIYGGCEFRSPWNIRIGNSVIGANSVLDARGGIRIGDNVCTSSQVNIWTMQHDPQDSAFGVNKGLVEIDDYAWISSKATILPGRMIGEGAVIANSSVVTKNCEPFSIYAGIPAHKIGERNKDLHYQLRDHWWFM